MRFVSGKLLIDNQADTLMCSFLGPVIVVEIN